MGLLEYIKIRLAQLQRSSACNDPDLIKHARDRRRLLEIMGNRLERHRNIWLIISIFVDYRLITKTDNFFDIKKSIIALNGHIEHLKTQPITNENIITAIRLVRYKRSRRECDADISELSVNSYNKIITSDFGPILDAAYDWLENYWDELYSSKRGRAKTERLEYYLEYLNKEKGISIYLKYPQINNRIQLLLEKYSRLLSQENDNLIN